MKPIRVLHVTAGMDRAGLETFIMNVYRNINREKVQFDFLLRVQKRCDYEDEIEGLGGNVYRTYPKSSNIFKSVHKTAEFFRCHKQYKAVHIHTDTALSVLDAAIARCFSKASVIVHSHNISSRARWITLLLRPQLKYFTNYRFACSNEAGKWLFGNGTSTIINNGIDTQSFSYIPDKANKIKKEFNLEDKFVVGHVGRFSHQKNHRFLLKIFKQIKQREPNSVLVLVGRGELEKYVMEDVHLLGLGDSVRFLGVRSDINEIMLMFDVFLFPSLFEGLAVAAIEAQASGLKCFFSDTVSTEVKITDLVEFIPLTQSPAYWAAQILKHKDDFVRKDRYAEIVQNKFDIKENAKWLEEFYLNKC